MEQPHPLIARQVEVPHEQAAPGRVAEYNVGVGAGVDINSELGCLVFIFFIIILCSKGYSN